MAAGIELTPDRAFGHRVTRLAVVSLVALGLIWWLARSMVRAGPAIGWLLVVGWALMPTILAASLTWPRLRYALVVPSAAVSVALVAICLTALPAEPLLRAGWLLITGGVLLGGTMGLWFWFRWMPVPPRLADPFSPGRWAMIGLHVGLVVIGLVLVGL